MAASLINTRTNRIQTVYFSWNESSSDIDRQIDRQINNWLLKHDCEVIDIKYAMAYHGGHYKQFMSALLIYRDLNESSNYSDSKS